MKIRIKKIFVEIFTYQQCIYIFSYLYLKEDIRDYYIFFWRNVTFKVYLLLIITITYDSEKIIYIMYKLL